MPPAIGTAIAIASLFGVALTLLEKRWADRVPSATGIGMGMLLPGTVVVTMLIGAVARTIWARFDLDHETRLAVPLASGLIAGEALVAVVIALLPLGAVRY